MNESKIIKIKLSFITFGVIVGIMGILHGAGELLKGNVIITENFTTALPEGWPNKNFATDLKSSPVFSVLTEIPFYVLGLLAMTISTTMIIFSLTLSKISVKNLILFSLVSIGVFLFGAGKGTPIAICFPLLVFGILYLIINKQKPRSKSSRKNILTAYNIFYWLQIISWIMIFPVFFVISFYQPIPKLLLMLDFWIMPIAILGLGITGLMYDKSKEI